MTLVNSIVAFLPLPSGILTDAVVVFALVAAMLCAAFGGMIAGRAAREGKKSLMILAGIVTTLSLIMTIVIALILFFFPEFRA